jgi:CheY-like chemotaxis protein
VPRGELSRVGDRDVLMWQGEQVPLVDLAHALELDAPVPDSDEVPVVLVDAAGELYGLTVERLVERREIVQKSLGDLLEQVPCVGGATLLGDRVALILDPIQVVQRGIMRRQREQPRAVAAAPVEAARSGRPRVLVAEDSDVERETIKRLLENHGCDVVVARDGNEALALCERDARGFDLISTDVMMPGLDGYELTRRLRALERFHGVPIVMVTSRAEQIDRVRGFDAGVDEYLVKPVDPGELVRAVLRHLPKKGLH